MMSTARDQILASAHRHLDLALALVPRDGTYDLEDWSYAAHRSLDAFAARGVGEDEIVAYVLIQIDRICDVVTSDVLAA